jgi:hypothetical protein
MIVHIMSMYNSKHPHTWDESLPYVQHSYNNTLHSSIDHSPFQVDLGFQPLGPIDVALPLATTQTDSSLDQSAIEKPPDSLSRFNTSANRSRRFCRNPMLSTRNAMINIGYYTSFRLAINSSYTCRRSVSPSPIGSFAHLVMCPTLSPRLWVAMLLSSTLHPSLFCLQYLIWTSFGHIFPPYWTPLISLNN